MNKYNDKPELQDLSLGEATEYQSNYSSELLQAVPRRLNRETLGIVEKQPFVGCDVWHAYEVSWLNAKGKPVVALARCLVNANSENIVESKSFKLYLNSFNQTRFVSQDEVVKTLVRDLSNVAGNVVQIELFSPDEVSAFPVEPLPGECIDHLDIEVSDFTLNPSSLVLDTNNDHVQETLHSHLLKSNCLITNQPDWASVVIEYQGAKIDREGLLRYLISFRQHNEFHEQCVERIFTDIQRFCSPEELIVQALYTRRGGLDINPFRRSKNCSSNSSNSSLNSFQDVALRRINRQ